MMLPSMRLLRQQLAAIIDGKANQGHQTKGLRTALPRVPESYDALAAFAESLRHLPLREDWPYVEPNALDEIWAECDPERPLGLIGSIIPDDAARGAAAAFEGAVAGCILGKPLEVDPTLAEIRAAAEAVGEWPLCDYISEGLLDALGRRHRSWTETTRGRIGYVAADDDLNYDIIGMLLLEQHGVGFTREDVMECWLYNLPLGWTFGPERTTLVKAGMRFLGHGPEGPPFDEWTELWNPNDEACGAAIRVDAYGYACPGQPALAAELAWRDAGWTHRRTGIYGAMFVAAAIATAFVAPDWRSIFQTALQYVPRRSRFHEITADCLAMVAEVGDWLDGYERIHAKYAQHGACHIYQEVGTLINTVRFAEDVGDGICKQVSQGCDTDCFGEIAGSILGAHFGPGALEARWLAPFADTVHTAVAGCPDQSLASVTRRMAALPALTLAAGAETGAP
jgi:hypothetical protein